MNIPKRILFFLGLITIVAATASASYRLVLQSGHEDLPVAVDWHEKTDSVISIGEDGRLIVTRPEDSRVLHRFRVSDDPVRGFAVNPSEDRAAIVTGGTEGFTVSVWDWNKEEQVYDYKLDSEPLFLTWSAKGRYLTIGNLGTPTIVVLEGRTGRRLSYLQRLPSLYNDAYIGSTESILMTYASSGSIRYWDIRSSALKLSAETISNLQNITVLQTGSKSTLFGYRNETLYLINRQTGAVLDQLDIPGLVDVSIDARTGEMEVLSTNLVGASIHSYGTETERFLPRNFGSDNLSMEAAIQALDPALTPVKILRRQGTSFIMTDEGVLYSNANLRFEPVISDRIWRPDSLAFDGESIYLSNGPEVQRFTSPFFAEDSKGKIEDLNQLNREDRTVSTRAKDTGLTILGDGDLLLWDKSGAITENGIRKFRFSGTEDSLIPVSGIIQKLDVISNGRLLTVDRSGTVSILDTSDGEVLTRYSALGVLDAAYSPDGNFVIAGRSSSGRAGTPLEQVDMSTREAIPVSDNRFMIYSVVAGSDGLYTIGVSEGIGANDGKTILMHHDMDRPERSRKILETNGENMAAFVSPDVDGNGLFTNLSGTLQYITGSKKTDFKWDEPLRSVESRGNILYGIDGDGALVLWNKKSGRSLLRVYFFDGGDWIALPPDGDKIWASPGAIENVVLYRNGRKVDPRRVSTSATIDSDSAM